MKYVFHSLYLIMLLFSLVSRGEEVQTMTFEEGMTLVVYTDKPETKQVESEESELNQGKGE